MSRPRPIYEEDIVFVTRNCHRREYLLTPNEEVRNLFGYLAVVLSKERNIDLYGIAAQPNHHHTDLKDNDGNLPKFTQDFHSFSARALNRLFGDEGSVWNSSQTSHVALVDDKAVLDKLVYTLLNPVKDGLVEKREDYPSLCMGWPDEPIEFRRPDFWFNPKAKKKDGTKRWPDKVRWDPPRPDIFRDLSDRDLKAIVLERLQADGDAYRAEHEGNYVGAEKLKTRDRHDRPVHERPRSKISPTVAGLRKKRIARLILNQTFREKYEKALPAYIAGARVVFPYGTYKMRVLYRVNVAPRPAPPAPAPLPPPPPPTPPP